MNDKPTADKNNDNSNFSNKVGASVKRRMNAERDGDKGVWFGLGMMGLIGWSVVVPTLLGAALGLWLDKKNFGEGQWHINWTLALIMAGLCIGCLNAWNWVSKEDKAMHEENEDQDE
jgi:ATP synthase protein I